MKLIFEKKYSEKKDSVVCVGVWEDKTFLPLGKEIDSTYSNLLSKVISSNDCKCKPKDVAEVILPSSTATKALVFGCGTIDKNKEYDWVSIGGAICKTLLTFKGTDGVLDLNGLDRNNAALILEGILLRSWNFDKYFTTEKTKPKRTFETLTVIYEQAEELEKAFEYHQAIVLGTEATKLLVSEVPNVLYPETFCTLTKDMLKGTGVEIEVLDEKAMEKLGMHSLLAVGQGSEKQSKLCILKWNGAGKNDAPLAFVGKGVTFDSGGISIKPSENMHEMKMDMAGAAAVVGTIKTLALRKANINAIGVVGLVENMPSGSAQRPGDVWFTMSGQTVECQNTDAEGRMVLADALWYTQDRFKPKCMIDIATLTGAIIVALGQEHAGLFSNDDTIATQLYDAGLHTGEKVWRLPLGEAYDKAINSTVADMKNVGDPKTGGSITAAQFLKRFVNNTPWAHLDIAAVEWSNKGKDLSSPGATGFGVRLLNEFVAKNYE